MNLYQKEKSRIHIGYHYFILGAFMFLFFMQVQSEATLQVREMTNNLGLSKSVALTPTVPLDFGHSAFWLGLVFVMFYLNQRLFWVRERGTLSFLLRKYDTLPVLKVDLYKAKGKILLKVYVIYLICSILIYYEVAFVNFMSFALWIEPLSQILLTAVLGFLLILALLGTDYLIDRRTSN